MYKIAQKYFVKYEKEFLPLHFISEAAFWLRMKLKKYAERHGRHVTYSCE